MSLLLSFLWKKFLLQFHKSLNHTEYMKLPQNRQKSHLLSSFVQIISFVLYSGFSVDLMSSCAHLLTFPFIFLACKIGMAVLYLHTNNYLQIQMMKNTFTCWVLGKVENQKSTKTQFMFFKYFI